MPADVSSSPAGAIIRSPLSLEGLEAGVGIE
jgi:hypothetical protein